LPSLLQLLSTCRELELTLNLEIKHAPDKASDVPTDEEKALERELATVACRTVQEFGPTPGSLFFSSFSVAALEVCHSLLPNIPRSYLVTSIPENWEETARRLDCMSLNFQHDAATREQVRPPLKHPSIHRSHSFRSANRLRRSLRSCRRFATRSTTPRGPSSYTDGG
jgi:glycerophosphoryl diester phosphodiesterase